jgi:hypothetical protein
MAKVTVRDAILANVAAMIVLIVVAAVWSASALMKTSATTVFAPLPHSAAETLYKVGRYELLRDTAVNCENAFNQLVSATFNAQIRADWTAVVLAVGAIAMLLFNVWFLRSVRRDMDALRSNT